MNLDEFIELNETKAPAGFFSQTMVTFLSKHWFEV